MTVEFRVPDEFVEGLARRVAELTAAGSHAKPSPYLDVDQAAAYLACDRDRIYDLKAQGRLRYVKDGRRLLFRLEWLDDVLEASPV